MEENRENIERILNKSSRPQSSGQMADSVLSAWKAEQVSPVTALPPLISKRSWILIFAAFASLVFWIITDSMGNLSQTLLGGYLEKLNFSMNLEVFQASPVVVTSIIAFACMIGVNILIMHGKTSVSQLSQL